MHLLQQFLDVAAEYRHGSPEKDDHDYPKNDFNHAGQTIVEWGEIGPFPGGNCRFSRVLGMNEEKKETDDS